jgi:hypothetical protein
MTRALLLFLFACAKDPPEPLVCEVALTESLIFHAAAGTCDAQSLRFTNHGNVAVTCSIDERVADCAVNPIGLSAMAFELGAGSTLAIETEWCPDLVASCHAEMAVICEPINIAPPQTAPECTFTNGDTSGRIELTGAAGKIDSDGDGYHFGDPDDPAHDCDDLDALVHPDAAERENEVDDDCDGQVDEGTALGDADLDNFSPWEGDCDDTNGAVHPEALELVNDLDDDCDGWIDNNTVVFDDDGDGFSEEGALGGDCDDFNDRVYPGAAERADFVDQDCDCTVDEGTDHFDDDGDGWSEQDGDIDPRTKGSTDQNNTVFPGAYELPDGLDNDLDGVTDEGTVNVDDDGDGYAEINGDCDDTNAKIYPGTNDNPNTSRDESC